MTAVTHGAAAIRAGGVVAYPTEGVWGLGCDPRRRTAVERILALKGRPVDKGLILLAASEEQLEPFLAPLAPAVAARVRACWPGPVTWIARTSADCPRWLTGGRNTLAVRVTAHPLAAALARAAGTALVSTSANLSGAATARNAVEVRRLFGKVIDTVVEGELGDLAGPTEIRDAATGKVVRPAPEQGR